MPVSKADYDALKDEKTKLQFALWTLVRQHGGKVEIDMSDLVINGLLPGVLITHTPAPGTMAMVIEALDRGVPIPEGHGLT